MKEVLEKINYLEDVSIQRIPYEEMSAVTTLLFFLMPIIIACISLMLNKYMLNTSKNALKLMHFSCTKYGYEDMLSRREGTCLLFFNS